MGRLTLHPLLLVVYSVLSLYAHNIGELTLVQVLPLAGEVLAVALLLFGLAWLIFRDPRKAGVVTTAILLVVLFYGYLSTGLGTLFKAPMGHIAVFLAIVLLLWLVAFSLMREANRLRNTTTVLNAMTLVLILVPLSTVFSHAVSSSARRLASDTRVQPPDQTPIQVDTSAPKPDVFFLIFDRYAASRTLKAHYGFDNRALEDFLREKDFYIATESTANYMKTAHSLAATFNMDYINHLRQQAGSGSKDWLPTYRMLGEHRVLRTFRSLGYRYIHLGSWWEPTRNHALADENYNVDPVDELTQVYLAGTVEPFLTETLLPTLGLDTGLGPSVDSRQIHCKRVPYKFAQLERLAERPEPVFVFAHILIPHPPFVFGANGRCMSEQETRRRSLKQNYLGQLEYANTLIREWVTTALANAAGQPPIILIQADEGPLPRTYYMNQKTDWREATDSELQIKFRILNTLYLPGVDQSKLYSAITPVNTFRLIFNEYFGARLPLLEDRSYAAIDGYRHIYDFFEITDRVR